MATVLVIGDTHMPGCRRGYVRFLQRIADEYQPDRVVHIGDLVDWHAISYHEKLPSQDGAGGEYRKAKKQVAEIVKAFPKADWMVGNHDALTHRQAESAGLPRDILKGYQEIWDCPWRVHDRFEKLIVDGVVYAHGDSGAGGKCAALNQAIENFRSTVIGHFHSSAGVAWYANKTTRIFGMGVGCGIEHRSERFSYAARMPKKPILGCGVVIGGKKAYFEPWLLPNK